VKLKRVFFVCAATLLVFFIIEGGAGCLLFLKNVAGAGGHGLRYYAAAEERRHTAYDEQLGWVGLPGRDIPDLYGPGNFLRTERHGFRNDDDVEPGEPAGKRRIICSGDSFAFGQGVANDETWCHRLGVLDPTADPVNMGQRGYGIDQAYLWYARDGQVLQHSLQILAFISGDFGRMQRRSHHGYSKPVLELNNGELVTRNVPVPRFRTWRPWMSRVGRAAAELHSVDLIRRVAGKPSADALVGDDKQTKAVVTEVFRELDRINRAKGSRLVLAWLPVEEEIERETRRWRIWLAETAAAEGWSYYDLSEELRRLDPDEARSFFIGEEDTAFVDAAGHYSEAGNAWAAEALHRRLADESWWSSEPADAGSE
jgi:hypothetical protein